MIGFYRLRSHDRRLAWIVATTVGLVLGIAVGVPLGVPIETLFGAMLVTPVVGAVSGFALGTSQSVALKAPWRAALRWAAATAAGMAAGLTLGTTLIELVGLQRGNATHEQVALVVMGAVVGLAVGAAQALVLRQQHRAVIAWVARSSLGMTAGILVAGILAQLVAGGFRSLGGFLLLAIGAALGAGVATAAGIDRLALSPRQSYR